MCDFSPLDASSTSPTTPSGASDAARSAVILALMVTHVRWNAYFNEMGFRKDRSSAMNEDTLRSPLLAVAPPQPAPLIAAYSESINAGQSAIEQITLENLFDSLGELKAQWTFWMISGISYDGYHELCASHLLEKGAKAILEESAASTHSARAAYSRLPAHNHREGLLDLNPGITWQALEYGACGHVRGYPAPRVCLSRDTKIMDGTLFVRVADLTMGRVGKMREGEADAPG
ncbi:hypothetical protein GY45DRAFT_1415751 [Cubamyces sp. BRFM 1775]|nr:hypothetical protein GY45DRAFT_1415751 [Cubamyces sp. BRFM 1775]